MRRVLCLLFLLGLGLGCQRSWRETNLQAMVVSKRWVAPALPAGQLFIVQWRSTDDLGEVVVDFPTFEQVRVGDRLVVHHWVLSLGRSP